MSAAPTVPPRSRALLPLLADCEERLAIAIAGHEPAVVEPATRTLAAGGKRVRPLLVFCSSPAGALDHRRGRERALAAAAAVELVHMATLVHDDVLDGARLRRGRPTVAAQYGAELAVATGDFLFARAFGELTGAGDAEAVLQLASATLELSRGEMEQSLAAFDFGLTEEAYLRRCRRKTGALFAVACRLGARMGGADGDAQERLGAFGAAIGVAFQIFDDILDITGSADETGKSIGTDLRDGTVTLPMILAIGHEPGLAADLAACATDADRELMCARLSRHAGMQAARDRALESVEDARIAVTGGMIGGADVDALVEIADSLVDRSA